MMRMVIKLSALMMVLLFALSVAFSQDIEEEQITLKEKKIDEPTLQRIYPPNIKVIGIWELYSSTRERIGVIIKLENRRQKPAITIELYDKNENFTESERYDGNKNYVGRILKGAFQPKGWWQKHTRISEEGAKLYVDALKVLDQIK